MVQQRSIERIQGLFNDALKRSLEERDGWLADQCKGNPGLLDEVRKLLQHDSPSCDLLEQGMRSPGVQISSEKLRRCVSAKSIDPGDTRILDLMQFLAKLAQVGVLSEDEWKSLNDSSSHSSADPRTVASQLVADGKLTKYQANALLHGRPHLLVDKYLILDLIDHGGMGTVFKAVHRPMGRIVALKTIRKQVFASERLVQRFQREVNLAAKLEHPNIVRAYDADQSGGVHFLVMEYVKGEDLAKHVQEKGPLSVRDALRVVHHAALGLQHAHKQGIIHRDIKPNNLILENNGGVKVLDMGLACIDRREQCRLPTLNPAGARVSNRKTTKTDLTAAGAMLGTAAFMAPEQALDSAVADTRSDIYSLGCTLRFLLTGQAPFAGSDTIDILIQHRYAEPKKLTEIRSDLPIAVERLCKKMMRKEPGERFASMQELIDALKRIPQTERTDRTAVSDMPQSSQSKSVQDPEKRSAKNLYWFGIPLALAICAGTIFLYPLAKPWVHTLSRLRKFVRLNEGHAPLRLPDDTLLLPTLPAASSDPSLTSKQESSSEFPRRAGIEAPETDSSKIAQISTRPNGPPVLESPVANLADKPPAKRLTSTAEFRLTTASPIGGRPDPRWLFGDHCVVAPLLGTKVIHGNRDLPGNQATLDFRTHETTLGTPLSGDFFFQWETVHKDYGVSMTIELLSDDPGKNVVVNVSGRPGAGWNTTLNETETTKLIGFVPHSRWKTWRLERRGKHVSLVMDSLDDQAILSKVDPETEFYGARFTVQGNRFGIHASRWGTMQNGNVLPTIPFVEKTPLRHVTRLPENWSLIARDNGFRRYRLNSISLGSQFALLLSVDCPDVFQRIGIRLIGRGQHPDMAVRWEGRRGAFLRGGWPLGETYKHSLVSNARHKPMPKIVLARNNKDWSWGTGREQLAIGQSSQFGSFDAIEIELRDGNGQMDLAVLQCFSSLSDLTESLPASPFFDQQ